MKCKVGKLCLALAVCASPFAVKDAYANDANLFLPSVYALESDWKNTQHDFSQQNNGIAYAEQTLQTGIADDALLSQPESLNYSNQAKKKEDKDFADKILDKLPYKHTLKYTWNVIDGDEDLGMKGLRADIGNKGVSYKTNYIPLAGNVEGTHIKAEMGDDQRLTLESDQMPLRGRVDGFKFKASVGDDARVSVRYKKKLEAATFTEYQSNFRR